MLVSFVVADDPIYLLEEIHTIDVEVELFFVDDRGVLLFGQALIHACIIPFGTPYVELSDVTVEGCIDTGQLRRVLSTERPIHLGLVRPLLVRQSADERHGSTVRHVQRVFIVNID